MRNHLGKILLIGIVVAAGYFVFNMKNVSGYTIPFINVSQKDAVQAGNQVFSKAAKATKETFSAKTSGMINMLTEKAGALANDSLTAIKAEAFDLVKGAIAKKVDNLAVDLGIGSAQSGNSGSAVSNPISISIKSGTLVNFTIENNEQGVIDYTVDWKDGKSESGKIAKSESKIVSHSWTKAGEYILQFKISSPGKSKEYQVGISIL